MKNIIFSRIEKHPLNNSYILFCPLFCLAPFIGTKKKCLQAQKTFETKLQDEFFKLSYERKTEIKNNAIRLYGYKEESFSELI